MKQLEEPDGCDCSATLRLTHGRGLMAWVNARVVFTYGLQRVSGVTASTSIDGDRGMDVDDGDSDAGASELECRTGSGRMRSGLIRHHVEKDLVIEPVSVAYFRDRDFLRRRRSARCWGSKNGVGVPEIV